MEKITKTKKCKNPIWNCSRQTRQQEWKNSFEKMVCFTCIINIMGIMKVMADSGAITIKEQTIFDMRFGFTEDKQTHTLEEVGKEFAVTRERIRQIESKIIEKIRAVEKNI